MKICLQVITLFLVTPELISQELFTSDKKSPVSLIYRLSDKEVASIYDKGLYQIDSSFFHSLVDTFSSDDSPKIGRGNFLKVSSDAGRLIYDLIENRNVSIEFVGDQLHQELIILDSSGDPVLDSEVVFRNVRVPFKSDPEAYYLKNLAIGGVLKVIHQGQSNFFSLDRSFNGTFINRAGRKVIYSFPIKWVWTPFRDIYKTIERGYPQGFVYRLTRIFQEKHRDYSRKYPGFMTFSQPKYRPGDTVKFKAFLTTRKGRPLRRPMEIRVGNYRKSHILDTLKPYRPGGFSSSFILSDSLDLRLDESQYVYLERNREKWFLNRSFDYQDYELKATSFSIRNGKKEVFSDKPLNVYLKGTDANGMNLLDASVDLYLIPQDLHDFTGTTIVSDTLFNETIQLEPAGETKLVVPTIDFPKASFDFRIDAYLRTSDQEVTKKQTEGTFSAGEERIAFELKDDTLELVYLFNGEPRNKPTQLVSLSEENDTLAIEYFRLPTKRKVNPLASRYLAISGGVKQNFQVGKKESGVSMSQYRSADSVFVSITSSRNIFFWYRLFHRNKLISSGYDTGFSFSDKSRSNNNYEIQYSYFWGGEFKEECKKISHFNKLITLEVEQPEEVFPGQTIEIDILAKDMRDEPIEGADVTAFAYTGKFKSSASDEVPYLGKNPKSKRSYSDYRSSNSEKNAQSDLVWKNWHLKLGLDSLEFYKFLYPRKSIYKTCITSPDSLTQFAPFYHHQGSSRTIHAIYLDNNPIYFSGVTAVQPYSFAVDSGRHYDIKLRLRTSLITIKNVAFHYGVKTLLSVSELSDSEQIIREVRPSVFTEQEKRVMSRHLGYVENTFDDSWAILEQGHTLQLLENSAQRWNRKKTFLVGPFTRDSIMIDAFEKFNIRSTFAPGTKTQFYSGLIREKETQISELDKWLNWGNKASITDFVISQNEILSRWEERQREIELKERLIHATSTSLGKGKIIPKLPDSLEIAPEFVLVSQYENPNFMRVYYRHPFTIHDLDKGYFRIVGLDRNSDVMVSMDSVKVNSAATTYTKLTRSVSDDVFTGNIIDLIEQSFTSPNTQKPVGSNRIRDAFQQRYRPMLAGFGNTISGRVTEENGEGLPGVTIVVKGTSVGTITDIDGYYSIAVPSNAVLITSYIGYTTKEVLIRNSSLMDFSLSPDIQALDEVVVIGYGVQKRSSLTGSVSSVLQGRIAGVSVQNNAGMPGANSNIMIRGVGSFNANSAPLIVVDGVPLSGEQMSQIDLSSIGEIEILKDVSATSVYGSRAAGGVIVISSKDLGPEQQKQFGTKFTGEFQSTTNSLRTNFRDNAWWRPSLKTDENGRASFDLTVPDDVTSWKTFVKAINGKRQSGEWEGSIKSYKKIMATLSVPRFLVEGDTSIAIGKMLNYTDNAFAFMTKFQMGDYKKTWPKREVLTSVIDSLELVAVRNDSLISTYELMLEDGYSDGEKRIIPVIAKGMEESIGQFLLSDKDTTFHIRKPLSSSPLHIGITGSFRDVLLEEIDYLTSYKYECNEQLSSKLIAYLVKKEIYDSLGKSFHDNQEIKRIIRKLERNQNVDGTWGWWKSGNGQLWVTEHVVKALTYAIVSGFSATFKFDELVSYILWDYPKYDFDEKIISLKLLQRLRPNEVNGRLNKLEKEIASSANYIEWIRLRQLTKQSIDVDSLVSLKMETIEGNWFWTEDSLSLSSLTPTLLAYEILQENGTKSNELVKVQNYLTSRREAGYWINTYQSSQIVLVLRNSLYESIEETDQLTVNGRNIDQFPYRDVFNQDSVSISKIGDSQLYFSTWQKSWNDAPIRRNDLGRLRTYFKNGNNLVAGQKVTLTIDLDVTKEANYVMIEVPIPGGCSYESKRTNYYIEEYREYYKEKVNIYCRNLKVGIHSFTIELMPRFSGEYTLNPAKAELMYAPLVRSSNELKRIPVR